jgi:hypothetical protein
MNPVEKRVLAQPTSFEPIKPDKRVTLTRTHQPRRLRLPLYPVFLSVSSFSLSGSASSVPHTASILSTFHRLLDAGAGDAGGRRLQPGILSRPPVPAATKALPRVRSTPLASVAFLQRYRPHFRDLTGPCGFAEFRSCGADGGVVGRGGVSLPRLRRACCSASLSVGTGGAYGSGKNGENPCVS